MISKTAFFIVLVMVALEAFIVGFAEGRKYHNENENENENDNHEDGMGF